MKKKNIKQITVTFSSQEDAKFFMMAFNIPDMRSKKRTVELKYK